MWDVLREEDVVGEEGDVWKHRCVEGSAAGAGAEDGACWADGRAWGVRGVVKPTDEQKTLRSRLRNFVLSLLEFLSRSLLPDITCLTGVLLSCWAGG